jgi:SAM-dependent methyltransferase
MSDFSVGESLRRLSWKKFRSRVLPGLPHLHRSRIRRCQCCGRMTMVLCLDEFGEATRCVRCGANFRYELLAEQLRLLGSGLPRWAVVELDPDSPLQPILAAGKSYLRTYYAADQPPGTIRTDGARCEDVTAFTLPDQSVDLLVSSEVLEHVPDLPKAAREITRVLRPGGRHLFTVPTMDQGATLRRAVLERGTVRHLVTPEYHGDPLGNGQGILAYWTFGRDAADWLSTPELRTEIVAERWNGKERGFRAVWQSTRL